MDASDVLGVSSSPLLTVDEATRVLRIGRSLGYQLARDYETSGGVSGLPVIRLGGCLRVPRWALLELALTGRVVRLCDAEAFLTLRDRSGWDSDRIRGSLAGCCW